MVNFFVFLDLWLESVLGRCIFQVPLPKDCFNNMKLLVAMMWI